MPRFLTDTTSHILEEVAESRNGPHGHKAVDGAAGGPGVGAIVEGDVFAAKTSIPSSGGAFVRLNNKRGALGAMLGVLDAKDAAAAMLDACSADGAIAPSDVESFFLGALNMRVVSPSVARAHGVLLADALESADEYTMAAVQDMEVMMDLDQTAVDAIYAKFAGLYSRSPRHVTSNGRHRGRRAPRREGGERKCPIKASRMPCIPPCLSISTPTSLRRRQEAAASYPHPEVKLPRAFLAWTRKRPDMHLDACAGAFKSRLRSDGRDGRHQC